MKPSPVSWTRAPPSPTSLSAPRTAPMSASAWFSTVMMTPPVKSMLRLSGFTRSTTSESTTSAADTINVFLAMPTKSKRVSPRYIFVNTLMRPPPPERRVAQMS